VRLTSKKPALWVWLELAENAARYSDNFFHLFLGKPVTITVSPESDLNPDEFSAKLVVRSLVDTY